MTNTLLQHYIELTTFLGQALGSDYEVALHDLTDKNCSIIAIENGHVSGREIGAPLSNVTLKLLMQKTYETQNARLNFRSVSRNGKTLRSSTLFIKQNGHLIGMLSISFDDSRYQEMSDKILKLCHPTSFLDHYYSFDESLIIASNKETNDVDENYHSSVGAVASEAVNRELTRMGVQAERLTPAERMEIITTLDRDGVFLLKSAVKDVADALGCSQASVYRYLAKVDK